MRTVQVNTGGVLTPVEKKFYGGDYSMLEKLRKGGVGSPKVLYVSGIDHFDELRKNLIAEPAFVNFELLKDGLIIRLNFHQRIRCVGIRLSDIATIELVGFKIEVLKRLKFFSSTKYIYRGELKIEERNGLISNFDILTQDLTSINQFFDRDELSVFFENVLSDAPTEIDFAGIPEGWIRFLSGK